MIGPICLHNYFSRKSLRKYQTISTSTTLSSTQRLLFFIRTKNTTCPTIIFYLDFYFSLFQCNLFYQRDSEGLNNVFQVFVSIFVCKEIRCALCIHVSKLRYAVTWIIILWCDSKLLLCCIRINPVLELRVGCVAMNTPVLDIWLLCSASIWTGLEPGGKPSFCQTDLDPAPARLINYSHSIGP